MEVLNKRCQHYSLKVFKLVRNLNLPFGISTWTTVFSLVFIFNVLIQNTNQLKQINFESFSFYLFLISLFIAIFSLFINAMAWRSLLYWIGCTKSQLDDIFSLYIRTNLYKYLPGGVWHFVARLKALSGKLNSTDAIRGVILEPFLMLSAAMLFAPLGGLIKGFSFIFLFPSLLFLSKFRDLILDFIKRRKFDRLEVFSISFKGDIENLKRRLGPPLKPLFIETLFIILRFISLLLCLSAFSLDYQGLIYKLLGAFSLAWSIGLIVPAAPGGVGVFESVFIFQVGDYFPQALLVFVLIAYRLIITLSDFLALAFIALSKNKILIKNQN